MKRAIKGALGVLALAGAAVLTGCNCAPVGEIVTEEVYDAAPVSRVRTIQTSTFEPVAESCSIPVQTTATFCD